MAVAAATPHLPPGFQESYIEAAHTLADAAARVTRQYFRHVAGWGSVGLNGVRCKP